MGVGIAGQSGEQGLAVVQKRDGRGPWQAWPGDLEPRPRRGRDGLGRGVARQAGGHGGRAGERGRSVNVPCQDGRRGIWRRGRSCGGGRRRLAARRRRRERGVRHLAHRRRPLRPEDQPGGDEAERHPEGVVPARDVASKSGHAPAQSPEWFGPMTRVRVPVEPRKFAPAVRSTWKWLSCAALKLGVSTMLKIPRANIWCASS